MAQGVIGRHFEKNWQNKTFWSFALNGQDGLFGCGMKRPPAVGTSVKFNEKTNAKGYKEVDGSIEILADGQAASAGSAISVAKQSTGSGSGTQSAYWDRKEARDLTNDAARELGASRNTAIAIVDLALKYEAFKLPAGAAKREEFLFGVIEKYAKKLMGKDEVEKGFVDAALIETSSVTDNLDPNDSWN